MFQRFLRRKCNRKVQQLAASRLVANMQTHHLQQIRKVQANFLDISLGVTEGLGATPSGCTQRHPESSL